jgi:hypothetical protein
MIGTVGTPIGGELINPKSIHPSTMVVYIDSSPQCISSPIEGTITSVRDLSPSGKTFNLANPSAPTWIKGNPSATASAITFKNGVRTGIFYNSPTSATNIHVNSSPLLTNGFSVFFAFAYNSTYILNVSDLTPVTLTSDSGGSYMFIGFNVTTPGTISYINWNGSAYDVYRGSTLNLHDNLLHTCAITHDSASGHVNVYIDGVLESGPTTFIYTGVNAVENIGYSFTTSGVYSFNGELAEFILWSDIISATDITKLHNRAKLLYNINNPTITRSNLAFTGYWTNFSGTPWLSTASAGSSGSNGNLVAGVAPSSGTIVSGFTPAKFDGSTQYLVTANAPSTFVTLSAGTLWVYARIDSVIASAGASSDQGIIADNSGNEFMTVFFDGTTPVMQATVYDGAFKTTPTSPFTVGQYHLFQMWWDGTNLYSRVNSNQVQSIACTGISSFTGGTAYNIGTNVSAAHFINGSILEIGMKNTATTIQEMDQLRISLNKQYVETTFNPTSVGSSTLKVWYDGNRMDYSAGTVTGWSDQSGNGNNSTVTGSPLITNANTSYNLRTNSQLTTAQYFTVPSTHGVTNAPYTIVYVGLVNNTTGNGYIVSSDNTGAGGNGPEIFQVGGTGTISMSDFTGILTISSPNAYQNKRMVLIAVYNGGSSKLYINSHTAVATGSTVGAMTGDTVYLGTYSGAPSNSIYSIDGDYNQFLLYNLALSQSDVDYLLNGFGAMYNISIAP